MRRKENKKLLADYAKRECELCGSFYGVAAHHIITRARGGPDEDWNLMALCFTCHRYWHDNPISSFIKRDRRLEMILNNKGFYYDESIRRLLRHEQEDN